MIEIPSERPGDERDDDPELSRIFGELQKLAKDNEAGVMLASFTLHAGLMQIRLTTINFPLCHFADARDLLDDALIREAKRHLPGHDDQSDEDWQDE